MGSTTTTDPARFLRAAEDFLQSRPVANSVLLTVCSAVSRRGPAAYGHQPPVFGWWRQAADAAVADRDLLERWGREMDAEVDVPSPGGTGVLDEAVAHGLRTLWLTPDGEPVAMAGRTLEVSGAVRVVAVYTPPGLRGRGYAGAAVTAVSREALDAGARHVLLVTDLANPVSNGLHRRLRCYRPVCDGLHIDFAAQPGALGGPAA